MAKTDNIITDKKSNMCYWTALDELTAGLTDLITNKNNTNIKDITAEIKAYINEILKQTYDRYNKKPKTAKLAYDDLIDLTNKIKETLVDMIHKQEDTDNENDEIDTDELIEETNKNILTLTVEFITKTCTDLYFPYVNENY